MDFEKLVNRQFTTKPSDVKVSVPVSQPYPDAYMKILAGSAEDAKGYKFTPCHGRVKQVFEAPQQSITSVKSENAPKPATFGMNAVTEFQKLESQVFINRKEAQVRAGI